MSNDPDNPDMPADIAAAIEELIGQSFHTGIMRGLEASPEHLRSAYATAGAARAALEAAILRHLRPPIRDLSGPATWATARDITRGQP